MKLAELTTRIQHSAFAFPLAILVAGFMLAISESAYYGADSQLSTLRDVAKGRLELLRVVGRVTDAETGQRGYLLTGRPEYLQPYRYANVHAMEGLASLQQLYARGGSATAQAEALRKLLAQSVATKLSEIEESIRLYDAGRPDAARELVKTDIGRNHMEAIRRHSQALLSMQNQQMAVGFENILDTLLLNRIGIAAMTALSLLVVALFLRQSRQMERQRIDRQLRDQSERDRLELEVKRRTAELTELAQHLQTAREDERARLARDLHDELGALLTAAKLDVARIRPKLQDPTPEVLSRVSHLTETLNAGIALKRRIIEDLRPSTLDQLGLCPALEILCREFGEQLGLSVKTELQAVQLAPSGQLTVYRLVQEALNNVAKYAQASLLQVSLHEQDGQVIVRVSDNGRGFDPSQVALATHGLLGMRFRIQAEQGEFRVQSAPGEGTTIMASLPAQAPEPDHAAGLTPEPPM